MKRAIARSGGAVGIKNLGALESSVTQPQMTFGGEYLYPSLIDKAAALAFLLTMNHPFVDGLEVSASVDDAEQMFLNLA
ncbi:type II toxin-antitoxin system death-on-curing family toxin, partial [Baaleninema simplex]|uniref:type II toxin-antitoxin system death-on-curing family toxin n=1 Tax=Baaleninema simplex TaxID=2862350 RepID=UPI0005590813